MLRPFYDPDMVEAGCDEAGRGALAGPVFAAAVILPKKFKHPLINDSKQLTEEQRNYLRPIIENEALCWKVSYADNEEIDKINILNASFLAMHRAIEQLSPEPQLLLIDGNRFNRFKKITHRCVIKGDEKFLSIAAASILAKTHRDEYMRKLHEEFPHYSWYTNKAYSTDQHREAIVEYGITPYHRKSFQLMPSQLELDI